MNKEKAYNITLKLFLDENKISEKKFSLYGRVSKIKLFELWGREGLFRIENIGKRLLTFFPYVTYCKTHPEVTGICIYQLDEHEYEVLETAYLGNIKPKY